MRRRQGKLISNLPQATGRPQREPILYICDFSRGGLNTRLYMLVSKPCSEATNIVYFIYCMLFLAVGAKAEFSEFLFAAGNFFLR